MPTYPGKAVTVTLDGRGKLEVRIEGEPAILSASRAAMSMDVDSHGDLLIMIAAMGSKREEVKR